MVADNAGDAEEVGSERFYLEKGDDCKGKGYSADEVHPHGAEGVGDCFRRF